MSGDEAKYQKIFHEVEKLEKRISILKRRLLRKEKNSENYKKALDQIKKKEKELKRKKRINQH